MAFCMNCGAKLKDGVNFCPDCGTPVGQGKRTPQASPAPKPAASKKSSPAPKRDYKAIGIAVLAAAAVFLLLSRCGGGGKEDKFLDRIQGYWTMHTQVADPDTMNLSVPWDIGVTENAVQLDTNRATVPMAEAEYKGGALYFSAQWYDSIPYDGLGPGIRDHSLRLSYDKGGDLLTLDMELDGKWHTVGEYARAE